jgi:ribosomal protein L12E/L44/L45/RPP1/RPP2
MAQVSGIEVNITGNTTGLDRALGKAEGAISGFARGAAASIAGALSAGVFIAAGKAAIDFSDNIGKMAQKVGMTTEELSKLTYAAKLSDVSLSELQVGVQQLSKNMEAGSEGLFALGISATDASGNLRSTNEVFAEIAEAFAGMEDGAGKTAIAMNIFGRSGAQLIPMLNAGRDGLAQMGNEAQRFGVVVTNTAAKSAEDFNDNLTRLKTISEGLAQSLVNDLVPPLNDILEIFLEYVSNGDSIAGAVAGIKTEFQDLARVVTASSSGIETLRDWYKAIDDFVKVYGPFSSAAQNGFFGSFPENFDPDPTGSLASIDAFNPQTVNREEKVSLPKQKPPSLSRAGEQMKEVADKTSVVPGVAPSQEVGTLFLDRFAAIQEGFKSERQLLEEEYSLNQMVLDNALNTEQIKKEEYRRLSEQLEKDHQNNLAAIRQQGFDVQLDAAASLFGSLAQLTDSGNKKLMKLSKAFSIAQVVINTAQGISKAFAQYGWPAGVGPAAAIAASGAVQLANIASAESGKIKGGGSGGSRGGGGGASAAPAAASPTTTFQFTMVNDPMGFGEKFARQFIDQLNSTQRNGGTIRGVIA